MLKTRITPAACVAAVTAASAAASSVLVVGLDTVNAQQLVPELVRK